MILCIVGPTGVGKTKLSIMLAKKYQALIINADACQIYKELNIGTAKINEEEKEGIEHFLLDIKKPNEDYSVFDYQKDARYLLNKYKDRNIVIVGGTGLYVTAALYDYKFSKLKDIDYSNYSNEELYKMCQDINPRHNLDIHNRRRLENYLRREETDIPEPKLLYDVKFIGLTTDRPTLYQKIDARVEKMFQDGLVKEVTDLLNKYGEVPILKRAIGYKEIIKSLKGEITLEEAKELIKKNSRHYAKRQYTWFNNKMAVTWFSTDYQDFTKTYEQVVAYCKKDNQ